MSITIVQITQARDGNALPAFAVPTTVGNHLIYRSVTRSGTTPRHPNEETWTDMIGHAVTFPRDDNTGTNNIEAWTAPVTVGRTTYTRYINNSTAVLMEVSGADPASATEVDLSGQSSNTVHDLGSLGTLDSHHLALLTIGMGRDLDYSMTITPGVWAVEFLTSRDSDAIANTFFGHNFPYAWWGHVIGSGSAVQASITADLSDRWGGIALVVPEGYSPAADFTATPATGDAPVSVAFTDTSTNTPTSWAWDFGDGGSDTVQNPTHTYDAPGTYTVTLIATNAFGSGSVSKPYIVTAVVWTPYARDRIILNIQASFTDDELFNHAIVVGTGNKSVVPFTSSIEDTDPLSPTNTTAIGDRTFIYESDLLSTQDAVNHAVQKIYRDHCLISEDVALDALCNPALEGNDIVGVDESSFSKLSTTFRIRAMSIPLATSRQSLRFGRVINLA